jgi:hypothetical protein
MVVGPEIMLNGEEKSKGFQKKNGNLSEMGLFFLVLPTYTG